MVIVLSLFMYSEIEENMGRIIEFSNRETLKKQLKHAYSCDDLENAYRYSVLLHQYDQSIEQLSQLAHLALKTNHCEEGISYLTEHLMTVYEDVTLTENYLKLLMCCGQYDQASDVIEQQYMRFSDSEVLQQLKEELITEHTLDIGMSSDDVMRKLYGLCAMELEEQLHTMQYATILDEHELHQVESFILTNPYIDSIAKTAFIQILVSKGLQGEIQLLWYGELVQASLKDIDLFEDDMHIATILDKAQDALGTFPHQLTSITREIYYHLMLLYPFHTTVIEDIDHWISMYVNSFVLHKPHQAETKYQERQKEWFDMLTKQV